MVGVFILIVLLLAFLVGMVMLQIYLSKRNSRWLGLILPGLCLMQSLVVVFNVAATPDMSIWTMVCQVASAALLGNIPTFVLLAIYFSCRDNQRRKHQMDKMQIQDL